MIYTFYAIMAGVVGQWALVLGSETERYVGMQSIRQQNVP